MNLVFFTLQEDERVISFERGKQLADSLGLEFFETSAKENINVRVSDCDQDYLYDQGKFL